MALANPCVAGDKIRRDEAAETVLSIKGKAYIAGIYEHPTRHAPDKSTAQLHAECAKGALEDAGLTKADVDGYFLRRRRAGRRHADGRLSRVKVRHLDATETGGAPTSSRSATPRRRSRRQVLGGADHVDGKRAPADAAARLRPRRFRAGLRADHPQRLRHVRHAPHACIRHHPRQLAWCQGRGLSSRQYNPARDAARLVTVEDVVKSPMISICTSRLCVV